MVNTRCKIHSLGPRGGHINVEYIYDSSYKIHPARAAARAAALARDACCIGFIQSEAMLS